MRKTCEKVVSDKYDKRLNEMQTYMVGIREDMNKKNEYMKKMSQAHQNES